MIVQSYKYCEVFHILEWRNGSVYRTESAEYYVKSDMPNPDPTKYLFASLPTSLLRKQEFEIDVRETLL